MTKIAFACPYCGKKLSASETSAGREKTCPNCRARVVVPTPEVAAQKEAAGDSKRRKATDHPLLLMGRRPEHKDLIDMTAMVDIVFFLLIFFLVTSMQSIEAVIGIPALDFAAFGQPVQDLPLYCVLKVGRGRFAAQEYRSNVKTWDATGELQTLAPQELEERVSSPTLICGEIDAEDRRTLERRWRNALVVSPAANVRRPAYLAEMAWVRLAAGEVDDPVSLAPIYVHTLGSPAL
jgi:DNA-directed RNA polymerase subunit RPC12/RpoP